MAFDNFKEYLRVVRDTLDSCDNTDDLWEIWCVREGSSFLDTLLDRVVKPDAAFGLHSFRYAHLSNARLNYHGPNASARTENGVHAPAD